jgi:hypothetical protein
LNDKAKLVQDAADRLCRARGWLRECAKRIEIWNEELRRDFAANRLERRLGRFGSKGQLKGLDE